MKKLTIALLLVAASTAQANPYYWGQRLAEEHNRRDLEQREYYEHQRERVAQQREALALQREAIRLQREALDLQREPRRAPTLCELHLALCN
jgi:hypothetical protein